MLHLNDITIGYRGKTVAQHLTAQLPPGTMTCLIGRNGTGKSTLLRTIAAFQPPLAGSITVDVPQQQTDIRSLSARQRARTIGVVLTEHTGIGNMTAREMVALGRSPYTGFWGRLAEHDREIVDDAMRMTGTTPFAGTFTNALSDGERQKVMIAKALAQQTPFIILDEPTAFLDYPSKIDTMEMLLRMCHERGKTVLLSTHDLDAAMRMTDRLWMMADGNLTEGTPKELEKQVSDFMNRVETTSNESNKAP
jgi:iron complex transport system ATP-binding protein